MCMVRVVSFYIVTVNFWRDSVQCLLMLELLRVNAALEFYGRQTVFSLAVVVSLQPSKEKMHVTFFFHIFTFL